MGKILPIKYDFIFKKMFGDPDNEQRLEALLSIMLNIPYETLKGKVQIIESEKRKKNKKDKLQRFDVTAKIKINAFGKINLEANLGFNKTDIDRNLSFLTHIFNSGITNKTKYETIEPVIQYNFNDYEVDKENEKIVDTYYLRNEKGNILTDKLQISNINIARCYNIWYSGDIEKFTSNEQEIIKICALMYIDDKEKFKTCLGEINMDEDIKKDIEETEDDFIDADDILGWYGTPEEYEALVEARAMERVTNRIESEIKEKVYNSAYEDGHSKGIEQGLQQGIEQKTIEIAKMMLAEGTDVEYISKITKLTTDEINNLRQE